MTAAVEADWDVVVRAQAGDMSAFAAIYTEYQPRVMRFVEYRTGNRWLAEDITADTFVRALRSIGGVTWQGRNIGAWLTTIARNLITDHYKSGRARLEQSAGEVLAFDRPAADDPEAEVLREAWLRQVRDVIGAAMPELTVEQQQVIALRFYQDLDCADTAAAMGKNPAAAKTLQHRATAKLRQLIPAAVTA